jgi:hypothetical protein
VKLFTCCCGWSYVIGKKNVYGAIWECGIGDFPKMLSNSQRMMTREVFGEWYSDCEACYLGRHHHTQEI